MPVFECPDGKSQETYLRELVDRGLAERYGDIREEVRGRADHELQVMFSSDIIVNRVIPKTIIAFRKSNKNEFYKKENYQ